MSPARLDYSTIKGEFSRRLLAHLIDVGIVFAFTIPFWILLFLILPNFLSLMAAGSLFLIFYISYFSFLEGTRFTTVGKKVFGLYVLSLSLEPISLRQALIRNVMRVTDSFLLYIPIFSEDGRRLGDGAAGTLVVSQEAVSLNIPEPWLCRRILKSPEGTFIEEKAIIRSFLAKLKEESKQISEDALNRLRESLSERLGVPKKEVDGLAIDTFLLSANDVSVGLLALALLTGTIVYDEEKMLRTAQEIYSKASEICYESEIKRRLLTRAKALGTLLKIKSGFKNRINPVNILKAYSYVIPTQFRTNLPYFSLSVLMFLSATVLGYFKLGWLADLFKEIITPVGEGIRELSPAELFFIILLNNARVSLSMCGGGGSVFITPVLLIMNGIMVGSLGRAMQEMGEFLRYYSGIIPHGLLELSAFFMSSASGLRIAKSLILPERGLTRYESMREAVDKSFELGLGSIVFLIPAALIESFATEKLMENPEYATIIGIVTVFLLYSYLSLVGRSRKELTGNSSF